MLDPLAQEDGYAEYRALVDSQSNLASVPHKNEFAKRLEEVGNTKSNTPQKKLFKFLRNEFNLFSRLQFQQ